MRKVCRIDLRVAQGMEPRNPKRKKVAGSNQNEEMKDAKTRDSQKKKAAA